MQPLLRRVRRFFVRQMLAFAADNHYRFATRAWQGVSDIQLISRLLEAEYFRDFLAPMALPLNEFASLLVLAPHQDDESIGAGGTLTLAAASGARLGIVFVTDGAQESRFPSRAISAATRSEEAGQVCARLGAEKYDLSISNLTPLPTLVDLEQLARIINNFKPDALLVPWLLDYPIKHRLVNHLVYLAHRQHGLGGIKEIWNYQVHNTIYPNAYVDITDVIEQKRSLIQCYKSQNDNFFRYDHLAVGLSAWNARLLPKSQVPIGERYVEVFFTLPPHEYFHLIETFYLTDLNSLYRGNEKFQTGINRLHQTVMQSKTQ
jgi:LmbE family N-acetylglucosaminyl deacetylase